MNRRLTPALFVLLFLFSSGKLFSQSYNFRIYTDDDGLAQSYVYAIDQAENGFLNISTGEGFCSFDGNKFKTFTKDDSLAENFISTHFEDSRGITWLGHYQNGISYRKNKIFYKLKASIDLSSRITCFAEDKNKNIWVSTQSKGVFKIDTAFKFINVSNSEATNASAITIDDENKILLGTNYGLFVYKEVGGRIQLDCTVEGFENKTIKNIIPVDKSRNSFWISVQGEGVFLVRKIGNCYASILKIAPELQLENYMFSSLYSDRDNDLWIGTSGEGLRKIHFQNAADKSYFTVSKITDVNGLPNQYILSIFQDREGDMWFGTLGGGLVELPIERFSFYEKKSGLESNIARSVFIDDRNGLWIGNERGLSYFNRGDNSLNKQYDSTNGFVTDAVTAIAQDYSGLLWIGTESKGLFTFDPLKKQFTDFSKSHEFPAKTVNCIVVNKEGTIIIATTDGVFFYYPETKKIKQFTTLDGLLHNNVLHVFIDDKNRTWFSSNGSAPYYLQDDKFTVLNEIPGLRFFNTNSVTQDKSGMIWISTDGDGVVSYDGKKFVNYTVENGLLSNYCYFITADNAGNIWVGHRNGLSLKTKNDSVFKSLSKADGLLITDFNKNAIVKDFNGDIWFGTNSGLIRYNYEVGRKIKDEPQTNILDITIDNEEYIPGSEIDLSYGEYSVHLDFISISLNDPSKVKYKYRLVGQDTTWRYTQLKFVDFPKLADGDYTFELIGCNGDNICNSQPTKIHFTISQPFWKKLWFYFVLLVVIIGISYSIIQYRIKALTKAKLILEEKVDEKTLQLKTEKDIVEKIKTELEIKNRDNIDSLIYAKRIQESVLPSLKVISEKLPKSFVFFVPRDIVSGDFYWFTETPDYYIMAAVDCTGHGVPGAFMSLVGSTLLNEIVINEKHTSPSEILTALNKSVIKVLKQENEIGSSNDGMDMALIRLDKKFKKLTFAGALRPLYLIRNKELTEIKGDSHSIGGYFENIENVFTEHEIVLQKNDMVYIFSDGYCDQFGEETNKKFSTKRFKELVVKNSDDSIMDQHENLISTLWEWKGDEKQIDDILVIGIKF